MIQVLRVGIIGLGKRWRRRYRPALEEMTDRFEVRALCDGAHQRAINEAHRLGCHALPSPTQLFESADIDAVLLLDPQWYRLWPLQVACRVGKPVFCCPTPDLDEVHAAELNQLVQACQLPVMLEMPLRFMPAAARLHELLETQIGPAQVILAELAQPAREPDGPDSLARADSLRSLLGPAGLGLLDWCGVLLGNGPMSVRSDGMPGVVGLSTVFLDYGEGKAAQLTRWRACGARRPLHLRVLAERGAATVLPPHRLHWNDDAGEHSLKVRRAEPLGRRLLTRFHQALTEGGSGQPDLAAGCRALGWLRAAAQSRAEGRRVNPTE